MMMIWGLILMFLAYLLPGFLDNAPAVTSLLGGG